MTRKSIPFAGATMVAALSAALSLPHPATAAAQPGAASTHEEDRVARTRIDGEGATLEVAFDPDGKRLAVRYRISNAGDASLAVFDRGDRHAVLTGRLKAGEVPAPHFEQADDVSLTLSHVARALPQPTPTVPPVPLATRLAPGASVDGAFEFDLSLAVGLERVRWCLGVAPFDETTFEASESEGEVAVWTASFDVAESQQRLCTPWFDVAAGGFEAD